MAQCENKIPKLDGADITQNMSAKTTLSSEPIAKMLMGPLRFESNLFKEKRIALNTDKSKYLLIGINPTTFKTTVQICGCYSSKNISILGENFIKFMEEIQDPNNSSESGVRAQIFAENFWFITSDDDTVVLPSVAVENIVRFQHLIDRTIKWCFAVSSKYQIVVEKYREQTAAMEYGEALEFLRRELSKHYYITVEYSALSDLIVNIGCHMSWSTSKIYCTREKFDAEKGEKERMDIFYKFVKQRRDGNELENVQIHKEFANEAGRLDISQKAPLELAELVFTQNISNEVKIHRNLLLRFTHNCLNSQRYLIGGLEKIIFQHSAVLLDKVGPIFKLFYDHDILEEKALLEWGSKVSKKFVSKEFSEKIHEKAKPFITWLQESVEEESTSDDES